ncbi:MAG: tetratricopeptide repeat protein [Bacteroidales bacterium]|nr:tetratricopeptide repeat protein [Bacteroidales bacterium]MCF8405655.1 tetratricopeptide repeat protein [Bacteroidales bacterium]
MKWIVKISVILILGGSIYAQNDPDIDMLLKKIEETTGDTARVNLLNKISEKYLFIDTDKVGEYARLALSLSTKLKYQKGIAHSYNNLGIYYRAKGIYNKSIDYTFRSLKIMEKMEDQKGIARCYNLIGIIYFFLENYDLSLEYYTMALAINRQQNDLKWIAGNSNNVGMIYEKQGKYELALQYYLTSLEMNIQLGNKNWIANNYGNIGSLYLLMGNPQSLDNFKRRLEITIEQNDQDGIALSNLHIGNYYFTYGQYAKAIPYYLQCYEIAKNIRVLDRLSRSANKLSASYAKIGNYEEAFNYHKAFKQYSDSLKLHTNTQMITRLQMQEEYLNERHLEELSHERSNFIISTLVIIMFFIILYTFVLFNRQKSKRKQHLADQAKLALVNKSLEEEIEFKEKQLEDNIHYLMEKNELISEVIEQLNKIKLSNKTEIQRIANEIIFELQEGIEDNIWEEFELRFNQIHSNFYKNLKIHFPNLSANDKKLCAFLKLNMTSREISSITHQSIKSVETARTRLRKKLQIPSGEISLQGYLSKY